MTTINMVTIISVTRAMAITASARKTCSCGIVRPKASTVGLPRNTDRNVSKVTARQIVFTPPPVDPGDAPTNIMPMPSSFDAG